MFVSAEFKHRARWTPDEDNLIDTLYRVHYKSFDEIPAEIGRTQQALRYLLARIYFGEGGGHDPRPWRECVALNESRDLMMVADSVARKPHRDSFPLLEFIPRSKFVRLGVDNIKKLSALVIAWEASGTKRSHRDMEDGNCTGVTCDSVE